MKRREPPQEEWSEFFEEYSADYAGWIVDLEWRGEDPERTTETVHTLDGIEWDVEHGEGHLTIFLTGRDALVVDNPSRISLSEGPDGDDKILEIESPACILDLHLRFPTSEIGLERLEWDSDATGLPGNGAPPIEDELSVVDDPFPTDLLSGL
jgi:hypothetical protein